MESDFFDFLQDENEEQTDAVGETPPYDSDPLPQEFGIDFITGQLTGEKVEGSDAVKVWTWLALKTARYRFRQFTWQYGSELEDLIGKQYTAEYTESQARHMVEDCLKANKYINGITDFVCKVDGDRLILQFTILTDFGREDMEIDV